MEKTPKKAEIFCHGLWDDLKTKPKIDPIPGLEVKYFCPDNKSLLGGLNEVGAKKPQYSQNQNDYTLSPVTYKELLFNSQTGLDEALQVKAKQIDK